MQLRCAIVKKSKYLLPLGLSFVCFDISASHFDFESSLHNFTDQQRKMNKKGRLSAERVEKLNLLQFIFDAKSIRKMLMREPDLAMSVHFPD